MSAGHAEGSAAFCEARGPIATRGPALVPPSSGSAALALASGAAGGAAWGAGARRSVFCRQPGEMASSTSVRVETVPRAEHPPGTLSAVDTWYWSRAIDPLLNHLPKASTSETRQRRAETGGGGQRASAHHEKFQHCRGSAERMSDATRAWRGRRTSIA